MSIADIKRIVARLDALDAANAALAARLDALERLPAACTAHIAGEFSTVRASLQAERAAMMDVLRGEAVAMIKPLVRPIVTEAVRCHTLKGPLAPLPAPAPEGGDGPSSSTS